MIIKTITISKIIKSCVIKRSIPLEFKRKSMELRQVHNRNFQIEGKDCRTDTMVKIEKRLKEQGGENCTQGSK